MRLHKELAVFLCLGLMHGLGLEASSGARAGESAARLVDVTEGSLYDGWGREAVRTLTSYYTGSDGAVEMLGYRASFLPVLDWSKGQIASDVESDLLSFYASGAGSSRVQSAQDPAYALRFKSRYQEPAGRMQVEAGAGYALGLAASQSRVATSDYQDWQDAGFGSASGMAGAGLEGSFTTASRFAGFGANLTVFAQEVRDTRGVSSLTRQAWQASGSNTVEALMPMAMSRACRSQRKPKVGKSSCPACWRDPIPPPASPATAGTS